MNILLIGDIVGDAGRRVIAHRLAEVKAAHRIDFVIGNAENAAGGFGITPKIAEELFSMGIDLLTTGNHVWDKREAIDYLAKERRILRPANYPESAPGLGRGVVELPGGLKVGVLQLMGRVFMPMTDCPFQAARRELEWLRAVTKIVIVDMHAEATSEKRAMGWYLDGQVAAVLGTHTHVQTADEEILPQGTAYLTDVGMTGPIASVIGIVPATAIERFLTQMPKRFETATGPAILQGAIVTVDPASGKATAIQRLQIRENL
ncbi:MAG: TIGR00282 family metallophosphoesterase [Nitrospirota bacterium]